MILVVYADPVVTLRERYRKQCGFEGGAVVECANWHRPYLLSNAVRCLDDYITATVVPDAEAQASFADACALHRPTHVVFVLPQGFADEPHTGYARTLVQVTTDVYPELASAYFAVSTYASLRALGLRTFDFITHAALLGSISALPERCACRDFEHQYLSWRMSGVLSDELKCRIGMDPTQFLMMHRVAVDSCGRELHPDLELRFSYGDQAHVAGNALGFANEIVTKKNETYRNRARALLDNPPQDMLATGVLELPDPDMSRNHVLTKFVAGFRSQAQSRLALLSALQLFENPFAETVDLHGHNRDVFQTQGFGSARLASDPSVEINLEYPLAALLELGDRALLPVVTDLWNRQLCRTASPEAKGACHVITLGKYTTYAPVAGDVYRTMQTYHTTAGTTDAFQEFTYKLRDDLIGWVPSLFHEIDGPRAIQALGRLLEKRYVTGSGPFFLTEFGAAVYAITHGMYGKFLRTWRSCDTFTGADANEMFANFRARCDAELVDDEATGTPKAYVREKPWTLVCKNSKLGKSCYWKQHTSKRGVDVAFEIQEGHPVPKLIVSPMRSYEKQDELGVTKYCHCTKCGAIVAHRSFSEVAGRSHLACPNCRARNDYYITPILVRS